ncbi:MAG: hypothetical protein IPM85_08935 [Chitinophagaceae bacterium]|nr:hypothetical protein [Chitinophagaceae bacterium]
MRTILLLFLGFVSLVAGSLYTAAQTMSKEKMDSLLSIIQRVKHDSNTVKTYTEIQRYYFNNGQYDSARKYVLLSIPVARKLNDKKRLSRILYNAGIIYTNLTRYDSARLYLDEGVALVTETGDTAVLVHTIFANALLSTYQSDYSGAVEQLMKAVHIIESSGNPGIRILLPQSYGKIGNNLIAENQYEKGLEYAKKALLIKNYPDEDRYKVLLYLDISDAYIKLKKISEAKQYLDSASQFNSKINNILNSLVLSSEGHYYDVTGDYPASLRAYARAYKLADSLNSEYLKAEMGDNVARTYLNLGEFVTAEKYALESNAIAIKLNQYKVAANTYSTLKEIAVKKIDFKKAYQYAELNKSYTDSASNIETKKNILNLEARYHQEKNKKEIASLQLSNAEKELAVVKRNWLLLIGGASSTILVLLLGFLYRNSRQKHIIAEKDNILQVEQIKFLERQQQLVSLQSMINGQETERSRIAKDLHDGLGGLFSTIKMHFSTLQHERNELQKDPLFTKSYEMVNTASEEVRRIAHNMMPEVLIRIGLVQAIQELCNSISAGKLLNVSMQSYGMDQRLNSSTEVMLFRIMQELINNIIKHAKASEAIIQFNRENNRLIVTVEDNGLGFNMAENEDKKTAGLQSVESRVHYLNGKLSIDSQKKLAQQL